MYFQKVPRVVVVADPRVRAYIVQVGQQAPKPMTLKETKVAIKNICVAIVATSVRLLESLLNSIIPKKIIYPNFQLPHWLQESAWNVNPLLTFRGTRGATFVAPIV